MTSKISSLPSAAEYFGDIEEQLDMGLGSAEGVHPLLEMIQIQLSVKVAGKTLSVAELMKIAPGQSLVLDAAAGALASLELDGEVVATGKILRRDSAIEFEVEEMSEKLVRKVKPAFDFNEKYNEGYSEEGKES